MNLVLNVSSHHNRGRKKRFWVQGYLKMDDGLMKCKYSLSQFKQNDGNNSKDINT